MSVLNLFCSVGSLSLGFKEIEIKIVDSIDFLEFKKIYPIYKRKIIKKYD